MTQSSDWIVWLFEPASSQKVNSNTSIYVGCLDNTAWVRIVGVATKDTIIGIRQYFSDNFSNGLRNFVIDLEECRLIDSTFIGVLTGLAGNIVDDESDGEVKLIHANERNEKSICKLGLDNLLTLDKNGEFEERIEQCLNPLESAEMETSQKAEVILKAHEDICSVNEKNAEEFQDVVSLLRDNIKK